MSSTMQDLIHKNASLAYQQGINRGIVQERERILKLLEASGPHLTTAGLLALVKRDNK